MAGHGGDSGRTHRYRGTEVNSMAVDNISNENGRARIEEQGAWHQQHVHHFRDNSVAPVMSQP